MWIDKKEYQRLVRAEGIATEQSRVLASLQASMSWLQMRVSQLEMERAAIMQHYMGVAIVTPVIEQRPVAQEIPQDLAAFPDFFRDMGDDAAAKQGIGWDDHGNQIVTRK